MTALEAVQDRLLWLATTIVHHGNRVRKTSSGVKPGGHEALDQTDREIVEVLAEDARRSASEVGRRVGVSPSAVKRRIDRMEEAGVNRGYTVSVDRRRLGEPIEAFSELRFAPATLRGEFDGG